MTSFDDRVRALPPLGAGLGYRAPLADLFAAPEGPIACAEVVAEHFFDGRGGRPPELGDRPVLVHSLDLSLGSPGPLDRAYLARVEDVARRLDGVLLSDHLAVTRTEEVELGHLNPVPPTRANARRIAAKVREVQEATGALFLLENISTHLSLPGELGFADFYGSICADGDCGMLLDVTNLLVNCRNRGREPRAALDALDLERVVQLHVVGYREGDGRLEDAHADDVQEEVFDLVAEVLDRGAPVRAAIVERDADYPDPAVLEGEVARLAELLATAPEPAGSRSAEG